MYTNHSFDTKVEIQLNNGVYIFENEASTGKTRLCKLLKKLHSYGASVDSITYDDIQNRIPISKVLHEHNKVVLLDRYDMYDTQGHNLMNQLRNKCIILIVSNKGYISEVDTEDCYIEMTAHSITVS